jgi:1-acyl-sn-glycerol-3-phosphate acyltransferase
MTAARSLAARMTAAAIVTFAKVLTGVRALWHGAPQAAPTVYFANHTSHGDFVLLWAALPSDLRGTRGRWRRPTTGRGRRCAASSAARSSARC